MIYNEVSSTNTLGFEETQRQTPHGTVVLADSQTAGKGRQGRLWHSPAGKNLYFSIVLTRPAFQAHASWLPLVTGIALAETLELISGLSISLKWPNDIIIHDKKLAGILCEARQHRDGTWAAVVGIGINLNSDQDDFSEELQGIATSLKLESHTKYDRLTLLAAFLKNVESHYERLSSENIDAIRSEYMKRCITLQRSIEVQLHSGNRVEGVAVDIGHDGELLVMPSESHEDQTIISIRSGDVIHVRKPSQLINKATISD
ncbi:MAG: biotin--[acetyl-CoA-carboxylase] ligase [Nitrospirales bacterium]|nr:MAG: biotin--[acetyl-CoA-carboxylase] ligase [Nitrospirales bacterium]